MSRVSTSTRHPPAAPVGQRAVNGRAPVIELVSATGSRELAELIYESAAADKTAFAELYEATASRVYGIAARILGSTALAEEAALETYLEVWRTSARFSADQSSPIAWILAIALRRVVDRLGSDGDPVRHPSHVPGRAPGHDSGATAEEGAQMREALTWLRPAQLEALEFACRDRDRDRDRARGGGDPEPVRLTTILSTLVDASLWDELRRMDGTTYSGSLASAPKRGVSGDL